MITLEQYEQIRRMYHLYVDTSGHFKDGHLARYLLYE